MTPSRRVRAAAIPLVLAALAGGCRDGADADAAGRAAAPRGGRPAAPEIPDDAPMVAFLGDSISAGLHLPRDRAFPAALQRRLAAAGLPFRLVNAGVSGDTTAGGLARIDWILKQKPAIVVVELGANDGLRGVPVETIEANLREILRRVVASGAKPLLLGMRLPPNYGPAYNAAFEEAFERVADEHDAAFLPFFMKGVAGRLDLNLEDGIHPTAEGHERLAENVEEALLRLLR
ncbi:MAG TPA: arylesterase [Planctomycetota bacterium]|nr:arylesterase [Planctomycetota bacterium]